MNKQENLIFLFSKVFSDLYIAETLINMTIKTCQDNEFSAEYYGITDKKTKAKISAERNSYINMLTLLGEKADNIMKLHLSIEKEFTLQQNTDNCCR